MTFSGNISPYLRTNAGKSKQHLFVSTLNPNEGSGIEVLQVVITRGLQASGKSTWAKLLSQQSWDCCGIKLHWIRICKDDLRTMMGEYWVESREEYLESCVKSMIYGALMEGYCVVFDGLGLKEKTIRMVHEVCMDAARDRWILNGIRCKVELFYKDFPASIEDCIQRDRIGAMACTRRKIGKTAIEETAKTYEDVLKTLRSDEAPYEVGNWTYSE